MGKEWEGMGRAGEGTGRNGEGRYSVWGRDGNRWGREGERMGKGRGREVPGMGKGLPGRGQTWGRRVPGMDRGRAGLYQGQGSLGGHRVQTAAPHRRAGSRSAPGPARTPAPPRAGTRTPACPAPADGGGARTPPPPAGAGAKPRRHPGCRRQHPRVGRPPSPHPHQRQQEGVDGEVGVGSEVGDGGRAQDLAPALHLQAGGAHGQGGAAAQSPQPPRQHLRGSHVAPVTPRHLFTPHRCHYPVSILFFIPVLVPSPFFIAAPSPLSLHP